MFINIHTYRARAGEEDAIIALHESWEHGQRALIAGYLSGELLCATQEPQMFIDIARYENVAAAQAAAADPEQVTWRRRLASLTENGWFDEVWHCVWQSS